MRSNNNKKSEPKINVDESLSENPQNAPEKNKVHFTFDDDTLEEFFAQGLVYIVDLRDYDWLLSNEFQNDYAIINLN